MVGKHAWSLVRDTLVSFFNDDALSRGAAIAYYTIFSIAPILLIATRRLRPGVRLSGRAGRHRGSAQRPHGARQRRRASGAASGRPVQEHQPARHGDRRRDAPVYRYGRVHRVANWTERHLARAAERIGDRRPVARPPAIARSACCSGLPAAGLADRQCGAGCCLGLPQRRVGGGGADPARHQWRRVLPVDHRYCLPRSTRCCRTARSLGPMSHSARSSRHCCSWPGSS